MRRWPKQQQWPKPGQPWPTPEQMATEEALEEASLHIATIDKVMGEVLPELRDGGSIHRTREGIWFMLHRAELALRALNAARQSVEHDEYRLYPEE